MNRLTAPCGLIVLPMLLNRRDDAVRAFWAPTRGEKSGYPPKAVLWADMDAAENAVRVFLPSVSRP